MEYGIRNQVQGIQTVWRYGIQDVDEMEPYSFCVIEPSNWRMNGKAHWGRGFSQVPMVLLCNVAAG